ncbi:hypothetical protein HXX76_015233 [Chlamydomonas incerta]|uniref:Uncharacterized protein n=1 Tax=Chlamydomonas incerta TaxID=51695 RepID=A0A835VSB7_CHLIN|nr:hypothetical protein HXX76_015233 [Chlamydomonas incerta]|eukprot:KAG2423596.1 hypothetical protein HXX76_015233 [Chlamydomonas incerta]
MGAAHTCANSTCAEPPNTKPEASPAAGIISEPASSDQPRAPVTCAASQAAKDGATAAPPGCAELSTAGATNVKPEAPQAVGTSSEPASSAQPRASVTRTASQAAKNGAAAAPPGWATKTAVKGLTYLARSMEPDVVIYAPIDPPKQ